MTENLTCYKTFLMLSSQRRKDLKFFVGFILCRKITDWKLICNCKKCSPLRESIERYKSQGLSTILLSEHIYIFANNLRAYISIFYLLITKHATGSYIYFYQFTYFQILSNVFELCIPNKELWQFENWLMIDWHTHPLSHHGSVCLRFFVWFDFLSFTL